MINIHANLKVKEAVGWHFQTKDGECVSIREKLQRKHGGKFNKAVGYHLHTDDHHACTHTRETLE